MLLVSASERLWLTAASCVGFSLGPSGNLRCSVQHMTRRLSAGSLR